MAGKIGTKNIKYAAGSVVVIAALVAVAIMLNSPSAAPAGSGSLTIQLTDPPIVPTGTTALLVTYDGVELHQSGATNVSGFSKFPASGTVNLMNLTNFTQTVAVVEAQANQSFDMVRFDISSARIVVDNTTYNVTVPGGSVLAKMNANLNSSAHSGVLVDLTPTVVQIYSNTNQSFFIMVPSAKAIVIGKGSVSLAGGRVGEVVALGPQFKRQLEENASSNISISSASASMAGNTTTLTVHVVNNGNSSAVLGQVLLYGFMKVLPWYGSWTPPPCVCPSGVCSCPAETVVGAGVSDGANVSPAIRAEPMPGSSTAVSLSTGAAPEAGTAYPEGMGPAMLNSTLNTTVAADLGVKATAGVAMPVEVSTGIYEAQIFERDFHHQVNFVVEPNGTLELPYFAEQLTPCPVEAGTAANGTAAPTPGQSSANASAGIAQPACFPKTFGYTLAPHASANLTFSGTMYLPGVVPIVSAAARGASIAGEAIPKVGRSVVVLIPNQTYHVKVTGHGGVVAAANVTATGYINGGLSNLVYVTSVNINYQDQTSGSSYNQTMGGFLAHTGSNVSYTIPNYGGIFMTAIPAAVSSGKAAVSAASGPTQESGTIVSMPVRYNGTRIVQGFRINTPGFTLLGVSPPVPSSVSQPCPVCPPGAMCAAEMEPAFCVKDYRSFTLRIGTPTYNYTGPLSITETYTAQSINVTAAGNGTVTGTVTIGPFCPVESATGACGNFNSSVYTSRRVLLESLGGATYSLGINATGGFSGSVPAGRYSVSLSNCVYLGCAYSLPQAAVVYPEETTTLEINIDTGIA